MAKRRKRSTAPPENENKTTRAGCSARTKKAGPTTGKKVVRAVASPSSRKPKFGPVRPPDPEKAAQSLIAPGTHKKSPPRPKKKTAVHPAKEATSSAKKPKTAKAPQRTSKRPKTRTTTKRTKSVEKRSEPSSKPAEVAAASPSKSVSRPKKTAKRSKIATGGDGSDQPRSGGRAGRGESKPKTSRRTQHAEPREPAGKEAASKAEHRDATGESPGQTRKAAKPSARKPARKTQSFGGIALSHWMLAALAEADYSEPTPIQAGLIPPALEGGDLMGQAQTGTGKTAAFAIPILERLELEDRGPEPSAMVLVPTRELAVQVRNEFHKLCFGRDDIHCLAVYGGKPIRGQIEQLYRGVDVVVGTPGRVIDLMDRRVLIPTKLRCVVLDEADRMLDIGFRPDIEKILRRCPKDRQTLLLSATIPKPVERLARSYMRDPQTLNFSSGDVAVETIEQFYFSVDPEIKFDLLVRLLQREEPRQAIIFCRTKRGTEKIHRRLSRVIDSVSTIHGDLNQRTRDNVMERFREGRTRYLVATDVVGRGIDVTRISHIINYDIPQFCDDFVHRTGRAGRMGREGVAYTFVTPEEGAELTRIEIRINRLLKRAEMSGFTAFAKPEPKEEPEGPTSKPVFGRRRRRTRRAL